MPTPTGIAVPSDLETLTHTGPARKTPRKILPFTRHPKLLAKCAHLGLQACAARVLSFLLSTADKEGISWVRPREMTRLLRRSARAGAGSKREFAETYSLPSVRRALRQLKAAGFVEWALVPMRSHYPARVDGVVVWNAGRFTHFGGRVWRVNLPALKRVEIVRKARRGTKAAFCGSPVIQPPWITSDPDLGSPSSKDLRSDPAAAPAGAENEASETPSGRAPPPLSEARELAPKPTPTRRTRNEASETPGAAVELPRMSGDELATQSREELQRGSSRANESPASHEPPADIRAIEAGLAFLFQPPSPGTAPRRR